MSNELDKVWLITGVTGQSASYYCDMLLEKGYTNIHGIMRRSATFNTQNIDHIFDKLRLHYGDLTDAMNIHNIISKVKPDYIVNFAAQSHVAVSAELENYTIQVNTVGVLNILQSVRNLGLSDTCRIYQCGTSEEFGNITDGSNKLNEESPKIPVSVYAVSKLAAEQLCDIYKNAFNMFVVTGTLMNHESPRRGGTFVTKKITNYVGKYHKNMPFGGCGSPSGKLANKSRKNNALKKIGPLELGNLGSKRDWSHAKDMCDGIYLMLTQNEPKNYLLSNDTTHSVREFIELAFKEINIDIVWRGTGVDEVGIKKGTEDDPEPHIIVKVNPRYYRDIDIQCLIGDSSRARNELNWRPKYSFEDLVKEMVQSSLI
jgi:GDPmannose 4,6-dehydratase